MYLARETPGGVVLYRRNHKTTYVLRLTTKDTLQLGSRFYGRLFPERCEVSPDGKLFAYFAMRGKLTDGKSDPETWSGVCTPPWLKAHVFAPNGSTYGWGGFFLPGNRIVMIDQSARVRDQESIRPYTLELDTSLLSPQLRNYVSLLVKPEPVVSFHSPCEKGEEKMPIVIRHLNKYVASGYDKFDYVLQNHDGSDVPGAEDIVLANWAGWHWDGRLVVAAGRLIKFFDVKPGKPLDQPVKILDIEAVIA